MLSHDKDNDERLLNDIKFHSKQPVFKIRTSNFILLARTMSNFD
jgi:hypothetical protein